MALIKSCLKSGGTLKTKSFSISNPVYNSSIDVVLDDDISGYTTSDFVVGITGMNLTINSGTNMATSATVTAINTSTNTITVSGVVSGLQSTGTLNGVIAYIAP